MTELPQGWAKASLQELAGVEGLVTDGDWIESKDQDPDGKVRLIQLMDIGDGEFRNRSARYLTTDAAARLNCTFLEAGDVLIARMPDPLGRACVFPGVGQPAVTAVDVLVWRSGKGGADPRWLMHFVNTPEIREVIADQAGGTTRQRVAGGRLKALSLPSPPISEQRRIVTKLDGLFTRTKAARGELDRIPLLIEHYKHAILEQAFTGALTADWRSALPCHPMPQTLREVRKSRIRNELSSRRAKALANVPTVSGHLPALPSSWAWVCVEELASDEPRSIQSGPFGSSLLHSEFGTEGCLVIGIDNVSDGQFVPGAQHRIVEERFLELSKYRARPGDVLITVMATIGRTCVVPENIEPSIITKHVYRITVDPRLCVPDYLMNALRGSSAVLAQMGANVRGQTRPGINGEIVRRLFVPLAPKDEQTEIVRRLNTAMDWLDLVADEQEKATTLLDHLDQGLLAKAFRGELVPQDPDEEPAERLLERIRSERIGRHNGRRVRGRH